MPDEPVMLYSELNDDMWETRKVEVYADGRSDFANSEGGWPSCPNPAFPFFPVGSCGPGGRPARPSA